MDQIAIIIASGPSLVRKDVEMCEQRSDLSIIGVNNAYQMCERLDYLYACDWKWWQLHLDSVPRGVRKYTLDHGWSGHEEELKQTGIHVLEDAYTDGVSLRWPKICTGQNGGYQALNLAYLLGFNPILLLGYDMRPGPQGQIHWHEDHPRPMNNPNKRRLRVWTRHFDRAAPTYRDLGVEVINVSRETALHCFRGMPLEDALALYAKQRKPA